MQIKILTPLCGAINAKPGDIVDVDNEGLYQSLLSAKYGEEIQAENADEEKPKKKRSASKGAV